MRSDSLTVEQRVSEVVGLRLAGGQFHDLRHFAASQQPPWGVSDRQLKRYLQEADRRITADLEKDTARLVKRHRAMRYSLFARCMAVADYNAARGVLKDLAELEGLYPEKNVNVTGGVLIQTLVGVDPAEVMGNAADPDPAEPEV